jgi:hypothetical protein
MDVAKGDKRLIEPTPKIYYNQPAMGLASPSPADPVTSVVFLIAN